MEPMQPAPDPMDDVRAAQTTPKSPSMNPRAVAARRLAVQKNDQHHTAEKTQKSGKAPTPTTS